MVTTTEETVATIEVLSIRLKHIEGAHPIDDHSEKRILASLKDSLKKATDTVKKDAKRREEKNDWKALKSYPNVKPIPVNIPSGRVSLHKDGAAPEVHFGRTCIDITVPVKIVGEHWDGLTAALSHELAGVVGNCEVIIADRVL